MSEQFLREVEPHLERLARGPGNAGALAGLRNAFAQARAEAGPGPTADLARAAENLLSAQLDGYVSPTEEAAHLVEEAARGLFALDGAARASLTERLDAAASGIDTAALGPLAPSPDTGKPTPPLLTEREDGVFVTPGMFGDAADDAHPPPDGPLVSAPPADETLEPVASTTVAPQPIADAYPEPASPPDSGDALRDIAGDIDAAAERLEQQISALVTIASGDDETSTAVQHASGELAATAAEIKRHSRALEQLAEGPGATSGTSGTSDQEQLGDPDDELAPVDTPAEEGPPSAEVQPHSLVERDWIKLQGGRE